MPRPLHVLTLTHTITYSGGAERLAGLIPTLLDPERFRASICMTRPSEGLLIDEIRRTGRVEIFSLPRTSRYAVWAWWKLVRHLRRERVDVLHAHQFSSNVWGVVFGRLARVPVVIAHEHTWSYEGQPLRRFLDRELIGRFADRFLAVSRLDASRMVELEGVRPEKITFVPNGIPPLAPPSGKDVRAELGIAADARVVGNVCVLRPQKALDVLVRAAAQLAEEFPDLRWLVAGTGDEREPLEALARELDVADAVTFLGARPDVPDLLAAFDVAVNCSDFEGSPLSVMEYMAAGKAIVATAVGGTPDLIEDGVHGLLVERRDVEGFAAAVARVLREPALRGRLGAAARERQREEFTLEAMVRRLEALYEELAAKKSSTRST